MNNYNPEEEYEFVPQQAKANVQQDKIQENIKQEAQNPELQIQESQIQESQIQESQIQESQIQESQVQETRFQETQFQEKVSKENPISYNQYEQLQPDQPSVQDSYAQPNQNVFSQMPHHTYPVQTTSINYQQVSQPQTPQPQTPQSNTWQSSPFYPQASQMQASQMQASQMQGYQAQTPQQQSPQTYTAQVQSSQTTRAFQNYNSQYPAQFNGGYPQNFVWQQAKPTEQNVSNAYVQQNLQSNPYQNPALQPKAQKQKTSFGTKVFIGILCSLFVIMVAVFAIALTNLLSKNNNPAKDSDTNETQNINPFFNIIDGNNLYNGTEFKQDLILQADNGSTAIRSEDKKESTGSPDETAKDLKLNALPKDTSSDKYDTQSVYEQIAQSTVGIVCYKDKITDDKSDIVSQGTGTIVSKDGYIITNAHVIGNSKSFVINIILNNSEEYQAKVVGYDTWTDLAVLKIDAKELTAVEFGDSSLIKVGQDVLAIGNPGGTSFQNTLTKGIVSATDREIIINKNVKYIQIDAAINPGNSGGPLCNIYGQVIGINSAKISSSLYEGMGFAIPSQTVIDIANDLIHYGYIKDRVRIGISGIAVTEEEIYYKGYPQGVIIQEIDPTGPLADSKLKEGDIITAIDGVKVTSFQDIYAILSEHKADDKVTLTISRPNQ